MIILPPPDQTFLIAYQSNAFCFRLQGIEPVHESLEYPLIVHQPDKHDHLAFGTVLIVADHMKNVIDGHGFCFVVSDKRVQVHAPVAVNEGGARILFSDQLSGDCFPNTHRAVDDDDFHIESGRLLFRQNHRIPK